MRKRSLSNTQFSILSSREDFDWIASLLSIKMASERVTIGLRDSEKFSTRSDIKRRIGQGQIRMSQEERKRANKCYDINLWDVIKICLTPQQIRLINSI